MRILVTGGCGYIGSALVPSLLDDGHFVCVVDARWFGRNLPEREGLVVMSPDLRIDSPELFSHDYDCDCVIHLAAVANDPCGELNPKITWEVNALATMRLADNAARAGVPRFIYASSGSVYGVKLEERVTEDLPCEPISEYNKTKMVAERAVLSYRDAMKVQVLRPATVCGWSARTRLDVAVNALTISALTTGVIKVFGGAQIRPNLHIDDMVRAYQFMLAHPEAQGVFNVGNENMTILQIAQRVQDYCGGRIEIHSSNDFRSYRLDTKKIQDAGFYYTTSVRGAIHDLHSRYKLGHLKNTDNGYNLKVMPR